MQGRHKVWKSGGLVVLGGDNVPPPGRDRINWSAKNWGGKAPQPPPPFATALLLYSFFREYMLCVPLVGMVSQWSIFEFFVRKKYMTSIVGIQNSQ